MQDPVRFSYSILEKELNLFFTRLYEHSINTYIKLEEYLVLNLQQMLIIMFKRIFNVIL